MEQQKKKSPTWYIFALGFKGKNENDSEFNKWIHQAERAPTISLSEAKEKWNLRKKELTKISR